MTPHFRKAIAILLVTQALAVGSARTAKEQWVSVSSPHFTVLTPAGPEVAGDWARELEQFRVLLQQVVTVPESQLRPVTVVLFLTDKDMRPYKPLANGKPQEIAGLFVNFGDNHAIELSLDGNAAKIRRVIFHEVVHWYSNAGDGELPLWLEEGVAEVYSTFRATREGKCSFGNVIPEHLQLLKRRPNWSMEQVVATTADSPEYNEGERASQFYAASWLAVHYLLFGSDAPGRSAILRYLHAREGATATPAAFTQAFGATYDGFKSRLASYMTKGEYVIRNYQDTTGDIARGLVTRPATEAEIQIALATLLVGARPDAAAEAVPRLQKAAALDPQNPVVWQILGDLALRENRYDAAEGYLAQAIAAGSTSYYVHYQLGSCRSRKIGDTPETTDSAVADESVRNFRRSLAANPRFVPAYESLAGLMFAVKTPEPKDRGLLEEGARLAPDSLIIDVGLAACDLRGGRREAGRRRLDIVLASPLAGQLEARKLAAQILHLDDWNRFCETLSVLFSQAHYDEAVTLIDASRGRFGDSRFQASLDQNRQEAAAFRQISEAVRKANSGDPASALGSLRQIMNSDASANAKSEAARLIDALSPATRGSTGRN